MKLEQIESIVHEAADDSRLFSQLNGKLIEELSTKELLAPLIKKRIEEVIEQVTTESIQVNAKYWFASKVEKTYFERRDMLERVTFKLVRNEDKGIILEAYQRLIEKEENWTQISDRWGINPEKKFHGKYKQIQVQKLNDDLINALKRNEPGNISQPLRLGKYFGIVQVEEWMPLELNETMRSKIEVDLYYEWIDGQTKRACELAKYKGDMIKQ